MSDSLPILNEEQAKEAFDDALLCVAMSSFVYAEGKELLELNRQLAKQPEYQLSPQAEAALGRVVFRQNLRQQAAALRPGFGRVLSHVAVVFLCVFVAFSSTMVASADFRRVIYRLIFTPEEQYTLVQHDENASPAFCDPEQFYRHVILMPAVIELPLTQM